MHNVTRIQLKDLPKDMKISSQEMKKVRGGALLKPISLSLVAGIHGESTDDNHDKWIEVLEESDED